MKPTPVIALVVLSLVTVFSISAYAAPIVVPLNGVMFEGSGTGAFNSQAMPFGFSVRCYGNNCAGAIILGDANAVAYVTGTVTVVEQDTFMMSLSTSAVASPSVHLGSPATMSCSLVNSPPIAQGEANKVTMTCSTPAGNGTSSNAMVEVFAGK
jgi:hypothetical protein